ncbi:MAG TPA: efflux RND transporter periplasmic adaptor subunit [Casimicrobiaceae bacterium]|nr:efflux RND transporter periplasmic adaptor subunit [Casimicrobiaceae bacterium]
MIRDTSAQDVVLAPRPRRWRRTIVVAAGGIALIGALSALAWAWRDSTQSVSASRLRIATVTRGTLVRDAAVNGRVVAAVSPTLYAPAAGTVTLKVSAGDTVKRGDVVAEIDSPDLADQLKREQSTYEQMQAEVARQRIVAQKQKLLAQRDADTAEIDRVAAQRTYERIEKAGIAGVVAKNDFMKAQDALRSAEIRSRHAAQAAQLEGDDVALELKTRESQLERQRLTLAYAKRRVDELSVRAPVDGFIGSLAVANRSVVPANTALLTLVDLSVLEVELEVPETYAADLGIGMAVEITTPDGKAAGKLAALSPEVVRNQVLARVRFTGPQPANLRQSQRVSARLLIDERPNVLVLPRGPFVESGGGRIAYVVENGVADRRPIRIGATSVSAVEVIEGVKEGDKVVIAGSDAFENAQRVSINQ